jgi:membrane-bound serine protease (ClpP class)
MRSMMRSTAEAKRRDPQIAQAMVDPRIVIPGIVDSTMVLTFTTEEAIKNGYCEGSFNSIAEILEKHNLTKATILTQKLSSLDNIIGFLINPFISGILVLLIIGGIYFELQTPGVGFPSIAAVVAALLYFAPLYLEGLAENWEILIFVLGVILLVIELFAIPGFGVIGFAGIVAIVTGLTLALVSNLGFDFSSVGFNSLLVALFTVVTSTFISIIGSFFISKHIFTHRTFLGQLALVDVQNKNDGYSSADANYNTQVGKSGTARTILRPVGKVDIEGEIFDATAITGFIEKGETVLVVKYENAQLFVKKA